MALRSVLFGAIFRISTRLFDDPIQAMGWPGADEHRDLTRHLATVLEPAAGQKILDVGCGTGAALAMTVPPGAWGAGLERLDVFLTRRVAGQTGLVQGEAVALPFTSRSFDRVLCTSMFQYLDTDLVAHRALCEMIRVLAPGGRLVIADLLDRRKKGLWPPASHTADSAFHRSWLRLVQIPLSAVFYHLLHWYDPDVLQGWIQGEGVSSRMVSRPPGLVNAHETFDLLIERSRDP